MTKRELQTSTAQYDLTNYDGFDEIDPGFEGEEEYGGGGGLLAGTIRLSFDGKKQDK
jgi:hypothetical protein